MKYIVIAAALILVATLEVSLNGISPNLLAGQPCPIDRVTRPGTNGGVSGPDCRLPGGPTSPQRYLRSIY